MPTTQSKYFTYQQASLSQKVSSNIPILQILAGSDREISDSIGIISYLGDTGVMNKDDTKFVIGLLNVLRLSHFATSEKTNEISKLGFMLPKAPSEVDLSDAHE